MSRRTILALSGATLLIGGCALVFCYGPLKAWYVVSALKRSDDATRELWVSRAVALGQPAVGHLLGGLQGPGGDACAEALHLLAARWGASDERTLALVARTLALCNNLNAEGQGRALALLAACSECLDDQGRTGGLRLLEGACGQGAEALPGALALASRLLGVTDGVAPIAGRLARAALASDNEEAVVQAIAVCVHPEVGLLEEAARLMKSGPPRVRQAAVLAAGTVDGVREDALLACLHDEDAEVKRLAREALLARGLRPEQVELGRLLTHPRSLSRVEVLDRMREVGDVDPVTWVARLTRDPSAAVRTAAARAICERLFSDLSERLEEMGRSDPSPTVALLARYYHSLRAEAIPAGGRR
jgi:hypothetical protein